MGTPSYQLMSTLTKERGWSNQLMSILAIYSTKILIFGLSTHHLVIWEKHYIFLFGRKMKQHPLIKHRQTDKVLGTSTCNF